MAEVWMRDYIAMRTKDLIEEGKTDGRHTRSLLMHKSNYVVIGPLRTDFHKFIGLLIVTLCIALKSLTYKTTCIYMETNNNISANYSGLCII